MKLYKFKNQKLVTILYASKDIKRTRIIEYKGKVITRKGEENPKYDNGKAVYVVLNKDMILTEISNLILQG